MKEEEMIVSIAVLLHPPRILAIVASSSLSCRAGAGSPTGSLVLSVFEERIRRDHSDAAVWCWSGRRRHRCSYQLVPYVATR
ncbi:hypothetical protein CALVIDRAFT_238104 [Calocera viscosa TUFC12733]|uniref:Uncharacterized protein n=1 Tax=Calocera viscosa (strain TUFC12733) TaxID=1330018 RepID=A0A167JUZ2_CALVF|nr:hypothetical protein CALVIDRAFT_238104 [Calocera viscosa TUFC12733]